MSEVSCRIEGAFELISECFDELISEYFDELCHAEAKRHVCGWGDSIRETMDDAIRTYKRCVEKINEKIDKLFHEDTTA